MSYIKQTENQEFINAMKRIFYHIDIEKIRKLIKGTECISDIRKNFYQEIIEQRYEIVRKVYEEIK